MSKRTPKRIIASSGPNWFIEYDRISRDYAAVICDPAEQLIGICGTERAARAMIDQHNHDALTKGVHASAKAN